MFADRAVRSLSEAEQPAPYFATETDADSDVPGAGLDGTTDAADVSATALSPGFVDRVTLQNLLWEAAGVHRSGADLAGAAATLAGWHPVDRALATAAQLETGNLLDLGRLIVAAALSREESRGAHHRADFPDTRLELARPRFTVRPDERTLVTASSIASEGIAC
ncbi:hypothetical protein [Cryobacterium sp. PAMC25264]|uniref:hypothetical protein n=1 Tax=Cryobacterium sp. PAMC25264 TaxID=2861288 RepID=UPI00351CFE2C